MSSLGIAGTRMVVERRYSLSERNRADKVAKIDHPLPLTARPRANYYNSPRAPREHKQLSGTRERIILVLFPDRAGGLRQQAGGRDAGAAGRAGQVGLQQ